MIRIALILLAALSAQPARSAETGRAIFAGGCFWCVESDFDKVDGVTATTSGYIGGKFDNPTYESHVAGGDREAVEILYDPNRVTYAELLKIFFRSIDPTDARGQFCDRGHSYTTAVHALDAEQKRLAMAAKEEAAAALGQPIATAIEPPARFWPAEDYHQDFHQRNPLRYKYYRFSCGRDRAIERLWGKAAHYGIGS